MEGTGANKLKRTMNRTASRDKPRSTGRTRRPGKPCRTAAPCLCNGLCGLAIAVVALLLCAASAEATPVWTPEERISNDGGEAFTPQVLASPGKSAVIVWVHRPNPSIGGSIEATHEREGGSWQPQTILTEPNGDFGAAALSADGSGDALAIWQSEIIGGRETFMESAEAPFDAGWQPRGMLSERKRDAYAGRPELGEDAAGDAIATWQQETSGKVATFYAERAAGGAWLAPVEIAENAFEPVVAVNTKGDGLIAWMQSVDHGEYAIDASYRPAGGTWSQPVAVSQGEGSDDEPVIKLAPDGEALAAWRHPEGKHMVIQAATKPAGGEWEAPVMLSNDERNSLQPSVAIDAAGEAVAVWEHEVHAEVVQYAIKAPGGGWSAAATLSESPANLFNAQVAMNPAGQTIAIWTLSNGVMRSSILEHGAWSPATNVGGTEAASGEIALSISPTGHAIAVWGQQFGGPELLIYASRLDFVTPGPPSVKKLTPKKLPAAGGTTVAVTGTGFEDVTSVTFGSEQATSFNVLSPTELTAVAPASPSGKIQLRITTLGGGTPETAKTTITYGAPTITGVTPPAGPLGGGVATIEGTGFEPGTETTTFRFGRNTATDVECQSTTRCTVTVPAASRPGTVDVTAAAGKSKSKKTPSGDAYTYE